MPVPTNFWPQTLAEWTQVSLVPIFLISAAVAIFQLRRNVMQSRAAFLLELETKWDRIEASRKLARKMRDIVRKTVFKEFPDKKDAEQEKQLRNAYSKYLKCLKKDYPEEFANLTEYWGFYETVGLMVRRRYIPFEDVYLLYKGPLIGIDRACAVFINEWQNEAHIAPGLYENMLYLAQAVAKRKRRDDFINGLRFWTSRD